MDARRFAPLFAVSLLVLFTTCNDSPTPLSPASPSPSFAAKCGTPPCGKGPGGDKGGKGGQVAGNFSLRFDGNDGTYTPDSDALDLTHTFTIEGWIKPGNPNATTSDPTILSKWGGGGAASYGVAFDRLKPGHLMMVTHNGTLNSKIFSSAPLPADVWQHFAFVFDDGGQSDQGQAWLYIDGVLNISCGGALGGCWKGTGGDRDPVNRPYLLTPMNSGSILTLGRYAASPTGGFLNYYEGLLDEVRVWNVARTATEIADNMNTEISPKSNGLVAYWQMNEGRGQTLFDAAQRGRKNDMQLGDSPDADVADPTWALKWESLASLPTAVSATTGASDGSQVFVLGGGTAPNVPSALNQIYDPVSGTWSLGASFPQARAFAMASALPDGIHLVGGHDGSGGNQLANHDVYDVAANTWSTASLFPVPGHAGVAETVDGKMYVVMFGGHRIHDPSTDSWTSGTSRPDPAINPASGVVDGKIYVAGGETSGLRTLNTVHRYDPASDTWETLTPMPVRQGEANNGEAESLGGGSIGGRFCVFGGRLVNASPTGPRFSETFCYDPTTETWSQGPDMLTPRVLMASATLWNAIYALGGRASDAVTQSNVAERLVPDTPFP
jgi:hypothetical protein